MIIKKSKRRDLAIVDVIIPTDLVHVLFDPSIPTLSFNFIFYTCIKYRLLYHKHLITVVTYMLTNLVVVAVKCI